MLIAHAYDTRCHWHCNSNKKYPWYIQDDIEGPKAARLLKNKQDIDVQSNYHEYDIKDTGDTADDLSGRIVR